MGGFFTNHQITLGEHLKGVPTITNFIFDHKVQSSQGQKIAITVKVKVI
jgi:hypothetical protein